MRYELEACKILALKACRGDFDQRHFLSQGAKKELLWWCTVLNSKVEVAISKQKCYDIELFTDACMTAFGACFKNKQLHGK